jgi:hypothetical protein
VKGSSNRSAALLYAILAILPLASILLIIDASGGVSQLQRMIEAYPPTAVLVAQFFVVGLLTVFFAVICFRNTARSRRFTGTLFVASLFLAAAACFAISWVAGLFYLMPSAYLWLAYRRAFDAPRAA